MNAHSSTKVLSFVLVFTLLVGPVAGASARVQAGETLRGISAISLMQLAKPNGIYPEGKNDIEGEGEGEGEIEGEGEGENEGEGEDEGEGEGEWPPGPIWTDDLPWGGYLGIVAVIAMAYGIMWLAESPPSPCMVATAAYDTPMTGQIAILRLFRDSFLLESVAGTIFVDLYYRSGSILAGYIADHVWAAQMVRLLLYPILLAVILTLFAPEAVIFLGGAYVTLLFAGACFILRRRKSRSDSLWQTPF